MKNFKRIIRLALITFFTFSYLTSAQKIYDNPNHLWTPAEDNIYLQEVAQKIFTEKPIQSVAEFDGNCYAVINGEIYILDDISLSKIQSTPKNVNRIIKKGGFLWALSDLGLYRLNKKWELIDSHNFVDICMHFGVLNAATKDNVYRLENNKFVNIEPEGGYYSSNMTMLMEDGTQLHADPVKIGPIQRIASYSGTLYILRPDI